MENTGTALALRPPSDEEIESIRAKGRALALHKKETQELFRTLEGMEWGGGSAAVKGSSFSPQTRYALAQFCQITRANPMTQVDILGGKPYLNVHYWKDRVSNDPMFVDDWQRDISKSAEATLRDMGRDEEADQLRYLREVKYRAPDWATNVVETGIRRWMNAAPMEAIRSGALPFEEAQKWIVEITDFNFAGGRPLAKKRDGGTYQADPVGEAEPAKTAASRSYRRTSEKAFSSWMTPFAEQIRKAEDAIDAEWELVQEAPRQLAPGEPQAVGTGAGEPTQASSEGARALPIRGEPVEEEDLEGEAPQAPPPPPPPPSMDDERKRFFATLRDCLGISNNDGRKAWMVANGMGDSIKPWTKADYDKAQELIVGPIRDEVYRLCGLRGVLLPDLALSVIGKETPEWGKDWAALRDRLNGEADAAAPADL